MTNEEKTPNQIETEKRDIQARLRVLVEDLNNVLKKAAELGMDNQVVVLEHDDSKEKVDVTPKPEKVVATIPLKISGPKYPQVHIFPPSVDVIYPDDPKHPDHKDNSKNRK